MATPVVWTDRGLTPAEPVIVYTQSPPSSKSPATKPPNNRSPESGSIVARDNDATASRTGTEGGEFEGVVGSTTGGPLGLEDGDGSAVGGGDGGDGTVDLVTGVVAVASGWGSEPEQPEVASIATMPAQATPKRTGVHTRKG